MAKDIIGSFFGASQSHFRPFFTSKRVKSTAIGSRRPRRSKRRGKRPVGAHRRGARLLARKRPSDRSTDADQLTRAGPGISPCGQPSAVYRAASRAAWLARRPQRGGGSIDGRLGDASPPERNDVPPKLVARQRLVGAHRRRCPTFGAAAPFRSIDGRLVGGGSGL